MFGAKLRLTIVATLLLLPAKLLAQEPLVWSGPYVGLTLGYGGAEMVTSTSTGSSDGRETVLFGGFNWRQGQTVYGAEADVSLNLGRDYVFGDRVPVGGVTAAVDWISTIRGRIGIVTNNNLLFATGGLSYSDTVSNGRSYDWGYVFGGGIEGQISWRWIWRGEVLFHYYSPDNVSATRAELDSAYSVRLGVARQF